MAFKNNLLNTSSKIPWLILKICCKNMEPLGSSFGFIRTSNSNYRRVAGNFVCDPLLHHHSNRPQAHPAKIRPKHGKFKGSNVGFTPTKARMKSARKISPSNSIRRPTNPQATLNIYEAQARAPCLTGMPSATSPPPLKENSESKQLNHAHSKSVDTATSTDLSKDPSSTSDLLDCPLR